MAARGGTEGYHFVFAPWFEVEEYTLGVDAPFQDLDDEELALKEGHHLSAGQLAWRRDTIRRQFQGNTEDFRQFYPSNIDEAFRKIEGTRVFDAARCYVHMTRAVDPLDVGGLQWQRGHEPKLSGGGHVLNRKDLKTIFVPDKHGPLRIWHYPPSTPMEYYPYRFVIGADVAEGVEGGDASCARVLDRLAWGGARKNICATWYGQMDATTFGEHLAMLAVFYRSVCAPEVNSIGAATLSKLMSLVPDLVWSARKFVSGVPWGWMEGVEERFGWLTSPGQSGSRAFMISALQDIIRQDLWLDLDVSVWREIMSVVRGPTGNPIITGHDYTAATCITAALDVSMPPVEAPAEKPRSPRLDYGDRHAGKVSPLTKAFSTKTGAYKPWARNWRVV